MTSIEFFPTEILEKIFSYCWKYDQKRISMVCHRWADVVQPAMLQRTCLRVSYGILRPYMKDYTRCTRIKLIGKRLLQRSNRPYTCLRIEWRNEEIIRNMQVLSELVDVCETRLAVQQLFLRAPPDATLVQFFEKRREWLKDIVELHVTLEPADPHETSVYEMSFPHLRQLTWHEPTIADNEPASQNALFVSWNSFVLEVPELRRLEIELNICLERNRLRSQLQNPHACVLFLPTLELKTYPMLENVTIKGLFNLCQSRIDYSERCLQNLTVLTFDHCDKDVVKQICEKCPKLKELTIDEPLGYSMPLQISPTLSSGLEHLTIKCQDDSYLVLNTLNGEAVFSKLRSICLNGVEYNNCILVAPQLTTCNTLSTNHSKLILRHKEQISTLKVQLDDWINETVPPPPNVSELFVQLSLQHNYECRFVNSFLDHFPQLRRLTIFNKESQDDSDKSDYMSYSDDSYDTDDSDRTNYSDDSDDDMDNPLTLDCAFVEHLPLLEHFTAYHVTIRLNDVAHFAGLTSLVLSECVLKKEPNDDQLSLTALEYVRVYRVEIDGVREDDFPIRVNERQQPIGIVEITYDKKFRERRNVFSSNHFKEPLF